MQIVFFKSYRNLYGKLLSLFHYDMHRICKYLDWKNTDYIIYELVFNCVYICRVLEWE